MYDIEERVSTNEQVLIIDPEEMRIIDASQSELDFLGYTKTELYHLPVQKVDINFDLQTLTAAFKTIITSKEQQAIFPTRHQTKNGNIFDVEVHLKCFEKRNKSYISARVDIKSALKQAQEELKFNSLLFDNISDAVIATDRNRIVTKWNRFAEKLLGWKKEEVLGKSTDDFVVIDYIDTSFSEINKTLETERFWKGEIRTTKKNGETILALLSSSLYLDDEGSVAGVLTVIRDISERNNLEVQLTALNEKLNQKYTLATQELSGILERITDGFIAFDKHWNIVYINHNAAVSFNKELSELIGYNVWKQFPPLINTPVYNLFHHALNEQRVININNPIELFNKCFQGVIYPSDDGISVFFQDITERKKAESALIDRLEQFRTIVNQAHEAIWMVDENSITTYVNDIALQLLGYSEDELLNRPALQLVLQEYEAKASEVISKSINGSSEKLVIGLRKRDGSPIYMHANTSPIFKGGKFKGIIAMLLDLTSMKEAEEKYSSSEKKFQALFENSYDGIALLSETGIILNVSPSVEKIIGLTAKELIGTTRLDYIHPEDIQIVFETFKEVLQHPERTLSVQYRAIMPDKSEKWLECTYSNLLNEPAVQAMVLNYRDITSNKTTENKLRESEARYKKALWLGKLGHWEYTYADNQLFLSEELYAMYDVHKINAEPNFALFVKYIHPEDKAKVEEEMNDAIANGKIIDLIHRIVLDNGEIKYIHQVADVVFDNDGKAIKIAGMVQDVTIQQQTEQQLITSEKNFRALFEQNPIPMWMVDVPSLNFIEVNEAVTKKYGYSREEFLQMNVRDLSPNTPNEFLEELNANFITNRTIEKVAEHRLKNGQSIFVKLHLGRFLFNGRYVRLVAGRDITKEILFEKQLKESQEQLIESQRIAHIGSWEISFRKGDNLINCPIKCSDESHRIFDEVKCEGMSFKNFSSKIHPNDKDKVEDWFKRASNHEAVESLIYCICINNVIKWVQQDAKIVTDQVPGKFKMYGSIKDITLLKENEIKIEKISEERELLIAELTNSINDLKQFTFITSHNFRAPLSNLVGLLNLVDYNGMTEENKAIFKMFQTSTGQLNKTINDLIQILIIKNSTNVSVVDNDLQLMVTEYMDMLSLDVNDQNMVIDLNLEVPYITYNKAYLQSILINLMSNAIKYRSPKRELVISINTHYNQRGEVVLEVADNGLGINLHRHSKQIFGLYQRFHHNYHGEGLGLFIVKSQINALGGSIEVESEEDKGTRFIITFVK